MALNCKAKPLLCVSHSHSQMTNSNINEINDIGEEFMSLVVRESDNHSKNTHFHNTLNSLPGDTQCKERLENLLRMVGSSTSDPSVISRFKYPSNNSFLFNSSQEKTAEETVDYEYNNKKYNIFSFQQEQLCQVDDPCLTNNDSSYLSQYSTEKLMQMEEGTIALPFNQSYAKQTMPSSSASTSNRQSFLAQRQSTCSIQNQAVQSQQELDGKLLMKCYRNSVDYAFLGSQRMLRADEPKLMEVNIGSSRTFCSIDKINSRLDYSEEVIRKHQQQKQCQQQLSSSPDQKNLNAGFQSGIRQMQFQAPFSERFSIKPIDNNQKIQQKLVFQVLFEKPNLSSNNKEQEKSFERPACGQNERSDRAMQLPQDSLKKSTFCDQKNKIDKIVKDGKGLVTFQQQREQQPMKVGNVNPIKAPNRNNQSLPRNMSSHMKYYPQQPEKSSQKMSTYYPEKQSKELLRLLRSTSTVNQYTNTQKSPKRCNTTGVIGQATQTPSSTLQVESNFTKPMKVTNSKQGKHSRSSSRVNQTVKKNDLIIISNNVKAMNQGSSINKLSLNHDSFRSGNNNNLRQSSQPVAKEQISTCHHQYP